MEESRWVSLGRWPLTGAREMAVCLCRGGVRSPEGTSVGVSEEQGVGHGVKEVRRVYSFPGAAVANYHTFSGLT